MYEEIISNQRKTWALITIFLLFVAVLGYFFGIFIGDPFVGTAVVVLVGMGFTLFSYYRGDKVVLRLSGAKEARKKEYPHLVNSVEGIAIAAGIPKPKIYVVNDNAINAFATGRNPEHAAVSVTTGALKKLNRTELDGVIAHEISHIKNYDIKIMMLTVMLYGLIVLIADIMLRSLWFKGGSNSRDGRAGAILLVIGIVFAILAPFIAQLLKLAVSRQREFLADASGAMLTRYPQGLANALKKIRDDKTQLRRATNATAHLFISNPFKKKRFMTKWFSTHPDVNERIKRLESM